MSEAETVSAKLQDTERLDPQMLIALRANVYQLVGRCVLQAQYFEQLLKAVLPRMDVEVATQDAADGSFETRTRAEAMARMTLGGLVKEMLVVQPSILANTDTNVGGDEEDVNGLSLKILMRFSLPPEVRAAAEADLQQLVALRNNIVHHFLARHPLNTVNDISAAETELTETLASIQACGQHIRNLANRYVEFSGVLQSEWRQLLAPLFTGTNGDDGARLPTLADIHGRLREFAETHSVDGWAVLDEARASIQALFAGLTLKDLGFSTWRQLLNDSRHFDLKRVQMPDGAFQMRYRIRGGKSMRAC